ncbi:helix-turn-helix transcriptional regulator [Paenibacillus sp. LHD-117]|uniref:helix-turn-helix domain-containing protein n=1 Tax=Paenibacillus sp. LHD-117 TaxID=3071412 RepID=UPI0027DF028F|nr:helix-turn-helix transcriptional regulator [Paenibacillus sp. LHD-117]MDQ6418704.1 helix-turn-helix transcriptional regulator [Paenibacillus sp. LHD-117]
MIGNRMRELRKNKKLSQEELGEKLGVGKTTISQYESETRKPDSDMLLRISKFFEVSVDFLLGRTNDPQIKPKDDQPEHDYHFFDAHGVQFIARSKENLTPQAYKKMQELAQKARELFEDEDSD